MTGNMAWLREPSMTYCATSWKTVYTNKTTFRMATKAEVWIWTRIGIVVKSVGRKISRGLGNGKKTEKSTIKPLPGGGGQQKKKREIAKKRSKIALLSLYLLYLYHVWKSRGGYSPPASRYRRPYFPLPPAADAHAFEWLDR